MSQALQRVIVRMMVDPAFAAEVHAGRALPELSGAERAHLDQVDPRAFGTDPYRRSRLLQACIEELPVAVALLTDGGRALPRADAFFSSPAFHACVQERGVLVFAMGAWLEERVGPLARLELAVARARRRRTPRGEGLCLGPGRWPLVLPEGGLAAWQAVRQVLGPRPVEALVGHVDMPESCVLATHDTSPAATHDTSTAATHDTSTAATHDTSPEHLMVRVDGSGSAGLEGSSEGIDLVLRAALEPRPPAALRACLEEAGATAPLARELLDELVADGVLVEARPRAT